MIRYRKQFQIKTNRNGELFIETDLGQTWKTSLINSDSPISEWLERSAQGDLQHWQKDMLKVVIDAFVPYLERNTFKVYSVYQKGQGYQSRQSDVIIMRIPSKSVWFISTTEHTWILEESLENFPVNVEMATGSILERSVRQELYDWSDSMRGIPKQKIKYTMNDYIQKGIADA